MRKFLLAAAFTILLPLGSSLAGTQVSPIATPRQAVSAAPFYQELALDRRRYWFFCFFERGDNEGAPLDFAVSSLRLGVMFSDPHGTGFLAVTRNFSRKFSEASFSKAPGMSLLARSYHSLPLLRPGAPVIPYFQIGGGGVYTDTSQKGSKGLFKLPVEFNFQGGGKGSILVEGGHVIFPTPRLSGLTAKSITSGALWGRAFSF